MIYKGLIRQAAPTSGGAHYAAVRPVEAAIRYRRNIHVVVIRRYRKAVHAGLAEFRLGIPSPEI